MVITSSLGESIVDQILLYYLVVLGIPEMALLEKLVTNFKIVALKKFK